VSSFFELAWNILPQLLQGLRLTLELTVLSLIFGGALGILLALGRIYGNKFVYPLVTGFIELVRGTPLLVQLFIIHFGLPDIGILFKPFTSAIIAFSINTSAYQAEYLRGAIQSVEEGQMLAARSLGMSKSKAVLYVVLPQALRIVIPPWSNEAILMLKFTSLAFMVTVPELMAIGKMIATRNFRYLEVFFIVAMIYLITVLIFTRGLDWLEKRLRIPGLEMR
jgi:polar amino acid transport system permease protein